MNPLSLNNFTANLYGFSKKKAVISISKSNSYLPFPRIIFFLFVVSSHYQKVELSLFFSFDFKPVSLEFVWGFFPLVTRRWVCLDFYLVKFLFNHQWVFVKYVSFFF